MSTKDEIKTLAETNTILNSLPSVEQLQKWKIARETKKIKVRDKKDNANAGIPNPNSMNQYYDEHGDPLEDVDVPVHIQNLHKAHKAPSGERAYNTFPEEFINKPRTTPLPKGRQSNKDRKKADLIKAGFELDENNYIIGFDKVKVMINGRIHFENEDIKMKAWEFIRDYS